MQIQNQAYRAALRAYRAQRQALDVAKAAGDAGQVARQGEREAAARRSYEAVYGGLLRGHQLLFKPKSSQGAKFCEQLRGLHPPSSFVKDMAEVTRDVWRLWVEEGEESSFTSASEANREFFDGVAVKGGSANDGDIGEATWYNITYPLPQRADIFFTAAVNALPSAPARHAARELKRLEIAARRPAGYRLLSRLAQTALDGNLWIAGNGVIHFEDGRRALKLAEQWSDEELEELRRVANTRKARATPNIRQLIDANTRYGRLRLSDPRFLPPKPLRYHTDVVDSNAHIRSYSRFRPLSANGNFLPTSLSFPVCTAASHATTCPNERACNCPRAGIFRYERRRGRRSPQLCSARRIRVEIGDALPAFAHSSRRRRAWSVVRLSTGSCMVACDLLF